MRAIPLPTPEATEAFGASLAPLLSPGDAIALYGTLGAGKTTLARGLLRARPCRRRRQPDLPDRPGL